MPSGKFWLSRPKKAVVGATFVFSDKLKATVTEYIGEGLRRVKFDFDGVFEDILYEIGEMPLPHYIHERLEEKDRYQTVYAKENGSSAAPTADCILLLGCWSK